MELRIRTKLLVGLLPLALLSPAGASTPAHLPDISPKYTLELPLVPVARGPQAFPDSKEAYQAALALDAQRAAEAEAARVLAEQQAAWSAQVATANSNPRGYAQGLVSADQWPCLDQLWNGESGWNPWALNASSGAAGIPQALGHGPVYALGDAITQVQWGLGYIRASYGSPCGAWQF